MIYQRSRGFARKLKVTPIFSYGSTPGCKITALQACEGWREPPAFRLNFGSKIKLLVKNYQKFPDFHI
jgi:hypothetical protein